MEKKVLEERLTTLLKEYKKMSGKDYPLSGKGDAKNIEEAFLIGKIVELDSILNLYF